jgi:hypothetical protein
VRGTKVKRPGKTDLVREIADLLEIDSPSAARGASVDEQFLDAVHIALTGDPARGANANRNVEIVLSSLGLTYDPYWDTNEATEGPVGDSVTIRAYSRILARIKGQPRCFILNTTDAPVGTRWEDTSDKGRLYRYDGTVTGRRPFNEAGPGSRVIYYSTSKSSNRPMHFVSCAEVAHILPGWTLPRDGSWVATLEGYQEFPRPVPREQVTIAKHNNQHAISEISWDTYKRILFAGGLNSDEPVATPAGLESDPGADLVAQRIAQDLDVTWDVGTTIEIPATVNLAHLPESNLTTPNYTIDDDDTLVQVGSEIELGHTRRTESDRARDRAAEIRAISIATLALSSNGWTLLRDHQTHGTGYDLLFGNGDQRLKLEVKGIIGKRLRFNLTPKELWIAENDPEFLLMAVTQVLSPAFKIHTMRADRLLKGRRSATGYRISLN